MRSQRPNRAFIEVGLGGALLGIALVKIWRASLEASLWKDEIYSVQLATKDWQDIVYFCRSDFHPPLYYLLLKAWVTIARVLGAGGGVLVARSLNVVIWGALGLAVFILLRRRLASHEALVGALVVVASPHAMQFTNDLRSYGLAFVGSTIAFCILTLPGGKGDSQSSPVPSLRRWIGFVGFSSLALWSHLLSWLIFGLMLVAWLGSSALLTRHALARRAVWAASAAVGVAVLAGPWLIVALGQQEHLNSVDTSWMTPATLPNLARTFIEWLPFGRSGFEGRIPLAVGSIAGALCWLPLLAPLVNSRRSRNAPIDSATAGPIEPVVVGGLLSVLYVVSLWGLSRLHALSAFHGPRYPGLIAGIWVLSVFLAVAFTFDRIRSPLQRAALLVPLAAVFSTGQVFAIVDDLKGPASELQRALSADSSPGRVPVFLFPRSLTPFLSRSTTPARAHALEDSACQAAGESEAVLVNLNFWPPLQTSAEATIRAALGFGKLATDAEAVDVPRTTRDFRVTRLHGLKPEVWADWCSHGVGPAKPTVTNRVVAIALPDEQRDRDGWSYLELDANLLPRRWTRETAALLRFDRALPAGRYWLELRGYLPPYPSTDSKLAVFIPGARDPLASIGARGPFVERISFELATPSNSEEAFSLWLRRDLWSPSRDLNNGDPRRLGALLLSAAVEPQE